MKKMLTLCFAAMLSVASGFAQDKMDDHKSGDKMDKMDQTGKKATRSKGKMDDHKSGDKMHKMDDKKTGDKMDDKKTGDKMDKQ